MCLDLTWSPLYKSWSVVTVEDLGIIIRNRADVCTMQQHFWVMTCMLHTLPGGFQWQRAPDGPLVFTPIGGLRS